MMPEFWFNFIYITLMVVLVLVSVFMILLVLMQRSKQDGIGAAFGSDMTQSAFGAQTSNVLGKLTVYCAVLFFAITLTLSTMTSLNARQSSADRLGQKPIIPTVDDPFSMQTFDEAFDTYMRSAGVLPPDEVASAEQVLDDKEWQDIPMTTAAPEDATEPTASPE